MQHTLSVVVENKPGVLTRVTSLFARRGFNIDSLAVGTTEDPTLSRITIVCSAAEVPLEQITKQVYKLINVIKVRANMDIAERRVPQGGRMTIRAGERVFDLRVQTQPSLHGEHVIIRLLPQEQKLLLPPAEMTGT